jgi:hypothetical protein
MGICIVPDSERILDGWTRAPDDSEIRFISDLHVALYCDVSRDTVLDWIDSGALKVRSMTPCDCRIAFEDLLVFLKKNRLGMFG